MDFTINTNVASLLAQRNLSVNAKQLHQSLERLSSGYRINRTADDAAGYTISQNLVSQIRRMKQADRNTQDGIGLLQIAEGALSVIGDNLQRIRELTVQAANDTNSTASRTAISDEIQKLLEDIDRIAAAANFNGIKLLDGSNALAASEPYLQVGTTSDPVTSVIDVRTVLSDARSAALGIVGAGSAPGFLTIGAVSITTSAIARDFMGDIDEAINTLNLQRARIGSYQSQLESVSNNLNMSIENFSASNSRIRDTDVAAESADATRAQVLTQAATMVLSQTNNLPQMILQLLQR